MNAMAEALVKAGAGEHRLRYEIEKCLYEANGQHAKAGRLLYDRIRGNEVLRELAMDVLVKAGQQGKIT